MSDTPNTNPSSVAGTVTVIDNNGPKFKSQDGVNTRQTKDNSFAASMNIQLSVKDVTNIGVVQAEEKLRDEAAENSKQLTAVKKAIAKAEKEMQDALTSAAAATYEGHNATLTSAFNTSQWTFESDNSFQLVEGRSGSPDSIRVTASVTGTYRGPASDLTGKKDTLNATFKEAVPPAYYIAKTALNTATIEKLTLEEESMRIRRDLANLPQLERKAQAAVTEAILTDQGQQKMIETVKAQQNMKALPAS